jgi:hypothetical protein
MDGRRGDGRLLVNNKNGWAWLIVGLLLLLLLMSAQVDGTVYVRLRIHHALPNLFRVNNQNKAFFFLILEKKGMNLSEENIQCRELQFQFRSVPARLLDSSREVKGRRVCLIWVFFWDESQDAVA